MNLPSFPIAEAMPRGGKNILTAHKWLYQQCVELTWEVAPSLLQSFFHSRASAQKSDTKRMDTVSLFSFSMEGI